MINSQPGEDAPGWVRCTRTVGAAAKRGNFFMVGGVSWGLKETR
jgi:hypothetical protein